MKPVPTVLLVLMFFMPASATIINVPGDQPSIQAGIDASVNDDTVRVAPGTYVENINFNARNIVVGSWFLDDGDPSYISSTIIDGNQSGSVVYFFYGVGVTAKITGFTIQNGSEDGGIYCNFSDPTIANNTISGNSGDFGGGIYCDNSDPAIVYNTISENTSYWMGGGIHCFYSSPVINNNSISGNSADLFGGGIFCDYSDPIISYNTISDNTVGDNGGGIACDNSSPTISHNTITENTAYFGGGIFCMSSSPIIINTILWGDSAPEGPEIYSAYSSPVVAYCDIQGGWEGEGNIDCDPMFCDPENGNYYLNAASCCVGAGQGGADIGAFGIGCGIPPVILSVVPRQNEMNVAIDADISVTFDVFMEESSINNSTFVVNARTTGLHEGTITYDSPSRTATLDPALDFAEGEIVTVVLTEGIESSFGTPLEDPYAWSFTAMVNDGSGEFVIDGSYDVDSPGSIYSSDLDGDGDLDLAMNNEASNTVSICLNDGDATFAAPVAYPTGNTPYGLFAGDFDADGDMDLAISSVADWTVSVLMNNGDGSFAPRVNYVLQLGAFPASVFAGDLNGDGYLDLVTPNLNYDNVSVLPNNGDGTFGAYANFGVGDRPRYGFASDLDNDGDIDLSITNSWEPYVSILLNNGDGTFATQVMYEVVSRPGGVFASDFDGDGDNDLATSNYDADKICVLLNDGDGTLAPYVDYTVGDGPYTISGGDLDGDGDIDLTTSNSSDNISVLLSNGDGTFASHNTYPAGTTPGGISVSDLDGDGDLDMATSNYSVDSLSILLNRPPCEYFAGDCNHNGVPLELGDVVTMIAMYRGTSEPGYTCDCPPHGDTFAPEADPNGNCVALELGDVVTEIGAYRGTATASGCEDCPGSEGLIPGGDEPSVALTLKAGNVKNTASRSQ